ncbi:FG-GAP-like repeat-containing protein [Ferruginibacter sp. SUN106]|uniref:FG-GAP-like repeat-containing protein n=1 Tax=Ferruginibacter sp. SUN106 TaxID=2978348 RepID=UPI003D35F919
MHKVFFLAAAIAVLPLPQHFFSDSFKEVSPRSDFVFTLKNTPAGNPFECKKSNTVDTSALKQSDWYAGVLKNIGESEYRINFDKNVQQYIAPNRKQNLRAFYTSNQFTVTPRNDSADKWKLTLTLNGIYAGSDQLFAPAQQPQINQSGQSIQFNNNNDFITEYINNKEGIRQNFIINRQPAGNPEKLSIRMQANKGWFINKTNNTEIQFAKASEKGYAKKLTYNDLKVWDANHTPLVASFAVKENTISINVDTKNAVYPVTIDPLSTTPAAMVESNQVNAGLGVSVASAGDVNGDGYSDMIVGAHLFDNGQIDEGAAFVYHGSATGISTVAAAMMESNQAGANFGIVSGAGDVNGDGYSDVIVGAGSYDNGQTDEGAAFIYHGSATGINTTAVAMVESNQANATMGVSVAGAGDVNGDGYSDVIVGAYFYDNGQTDEGAAFVYHGSATGINTTAAAMMEPNQAGANFGRSVAGAGDVNGDGYNDVIVGAWYYSNGQANEGAAFIYLGSAAGINTTAATVVESNQADGNMGVSVASAGDVNGDGYSDVIAGAYFYDNGQTDEGVAFVYHGSAAGISTTAAIMLESNQNASRFGAAVACAGDVNGDGYSDIIVGAYFYDNGQTDEGAAFVYQGSPTGISNVIAATLESNQSGSLFGLAVASAGDVNGDGYSDVIVGAFNYDNGETDEGAAFVYHGSSNGLSAAQTRTLSPDSQNQAGIGDAVAGAGDVNGDGYSDVIIGASAYDDGLNTDEGRAWVYYGHATGLSATPDVTLDDANLAGSFFGYSVANAGDINGDGYSDVIVGAIFYDGEKGRAFVYYGHAAGLSTIADLSLDDANQPGARFGVTVSGAGDVNGDGYSDVIIGAYLYDDPSPANTNEGRAYVHYGSAGGLSVAANVTLSDADQANAYLGNYVASAGDVNGDGYSDVVVGASGYDDTFADEGVAFIYFGSAAGLSATHNQMLDDANVTGAGFGIRVASAGDVNGDGFADVVVTSIAWDGEKGRGWVYYGHAVTGLSATPDVILDNTSGNPLDRMGYGVSTAGDVNGDGYSDVIIGIPQHTTTFPEDGRAYIYYGSATGLSNTPGMILNDASEAHEFFGGAIACAGDINGDGYSDVIVGADHGSWASPIGGRAYVHNGNNLIANKRNNLRLYNTDLTTPINSSNFPIGNFGAGLFAKSFLGRNKGKLVWETRLNYNAFSGVPITNSAFFTAQQAAYTDLGLTGTELKNSIAKITGSGKFTKLRARVKYNLSTAITGQVYGPWRYVSPIIDGNLLGALPIELISFNAEWLQKGKTAQLHFTTDKESGTCCFDIEKSMDGFNFTVIGTVMARNIAGIQSYNFIDNDALNKNQFYRLKIKGSNGQIVYSNIQHLQNNTATEILVFPNPTTDVLQLQLNKVYDKMIVQIVNSTGQIVQQLNNLSVLNQIIKIPVSNLPSGNYWLRLQSGAEKQVLQFVKQ